MEWSEILDPELEPAELICERLPALHQQRLEQFGAFSKTAIIVGLHFRDTGERFTACLSPEDVEVERGEMIDFPQVMLYGDRSNWRRTIALLGQLVEPADEQVEQYRGRVVLTEQIKRDFERFDGVLQVRVTGLPEGPPMGFEVVLNDYEAPPRARRASLEVDWSLLVELAHGRIDPIAAARQIKVGGAMGLAFDLGGFVTAEFGL